MTKLLLLFFASVLSLHGEHLYSGVSMFETKKDEVNVDAQKNQKVRCRVVCDKKIYKEQKISEAIEFYKKSTDYKFSK